MRVLIAILLSIIFFQGIAQSNHWLQTFGSIQSENPSILKVDVDDNLFVAGTIGDSAFISFNNTSVLSSSADGNSFIYKQDSSNNLIWFNQIGGPSGSLRISDCEIDLNGNIYLTGDFRGNVDFDPSSQSTVLTSNTNSSDVFLVKYSSAGTLIWARGFGGNNWDNGNDILLEDTSNIYLSGFFRGIVDFNPGPDTNLILGFAGPDGFIAKFNSNGDYKFAYRIGGGGWDQVNKIMFNSNHDIVAVGSFQATAIMNPRTLFSNRITSAGGSDLFIVRLDTAGFYMSAKRIGGAGEVSVTNAILDNDTLYLMGSLGSSSWFSNGSVDFNPNSGVSNYTSTGLEDSYLVKLDPSDNPAWFNQFGGPSMQRILGFKKAHNGHVVVSVGIRDTTKLYANGLLVDSVFSQNSESIVVQFDANGNLDWLKHFNSDLSIYLNCLEVDSRGNIYSSGSFQGLTDFNPTSSNLNKSSIGQGDIFVMKNFADLTTYTRSSNNELPTTLKVYPNPTQGRVTIKADKFESATILSVRDIRGRKVKNYLARSNLSNLELTILADKGAYFVEINYNGLTSFIKVIKQ